MIETWRSIWREGFGKVLPTAGLEALAEALRSDDKRLTQGSTTTPPPLLCVAEWPVEAADAIAFCGWHDGTGRDTVGQVEESFATACFEADAMLGEVGGCRWFLNAWDDTPREEIFRELLAEVELVLADRILSEVPA